MIKTTHQQQIRNDLCCAPKEPKELPGDALMTTYMAYKRELVKLIQDRTVELNNLLSTFVQSTPIDVAALDRIEHAISSLDEAVSCII